VREREKGNNDSLKLRGEAFFLKNRWGKGEKKKRTCPSGKVEMFDRALTSRKRKKKGRGAVKETTSSGGEGELAERAEETLPAFPGGI